MTERPKNYVPRSKMPISERAKQFAPFAAITGLTEALHAKELEHSSIERIEMSEERIAAINSKLASLYIGEQVEVTYYRYGHYDSVTGRVEAIDGRRQVVRIAGREIHFKDLYAIK